MHVDTNGIVRVSRDPPHQVAVVGPIDKSTAKKYTDEDGVAYFTELRKALLFDKSAVSVVGNILNEAETNKRSLIMIN